MVSQGESIMLRSGNENIDEGIAVAKSGNEHVEHQCREAYSYLKNPRFFFSLLFSFSFLASFPLEGGGVSDVVALEVSFVGFLFIASDPLLRFIDAIPVIGGAGGLGLGDGSLSNR